MTEKTETKTGPVPSVMSHNESYATDDEIFKLVALFEIHWWFFPRGVEGVFCQCTFTPGDYYEVRTLIDRNGDPILTVRAEKQKYGSLSNTMRFFP